MAKLENVKVLEMSYGEITHVQYNGKIYERVNTKANAGDLVLVEDEGVAEIIRRVEPGAFYELYEDEYDDLFFKDDIYNERDYSSWSDELVLFRAIETVEKDIEKRVAELERRLSAIERQSERLKVGDYARVVGDTYYGDITENSIVKIVSDLDEDGDYKIELLDGSDYDYARPSSLEKYTGYNDEIERSKFKKGDIVRVLDSCGSPLVEGCLYEISGHMGNTEYVTFDGEAWLAEFELVAPVESRVDLD